jgi:hypothetical protein
MSLRMRRRDGREYVFRSIDKDVTRGFHPDLKNTLVDWLVQDQVSAKHPAAVVLASALQKATGVLHAEPQLVVMPDHPFLGDFRRKFAGLLGSIEERPEDEEGTPPFAGAAKIASTETLFKRLEEDPDHQVDARAFLNARLMDLYLGDWDRHEDQWRWARFDSGGKHLWRPIARDRDNAFVRHNGWFLGFARNIMPRFVVFDEQYGSIYGMTQNAQRLDRRLLTELSKPVWDSVALALQAKLSDDVIERAVRQLPPEYFVRGGHQIIQHLRARRAGLLEASKHFYQQLSTEVDVHATDKPEIAEVERFADGSVEVRIARRDKATDMPRAAPYFRRRFLPAETREVRLFLHGGDDHAVVRGAAGHSVRVRVIGGGGDDVLVDSSSVRGSRRLTAFYDHRGDNRFEPGTEATVDPRPDRTQPLSKNIAGIPVERDWGQSRLAFRPYANYSGNVGLVVGGGPIWTRYGFRREPHARQVGVRVEYAPQEGGWAVEYTDDIHHIGGEMTTALRARASQIDYFRFHGFGNDTEDGGDRGPYVVRQKRITVEPALKRELARDTWIGVGPIFRYYDASEGTRLPGPFTIFQEQNGRGGGTFGQLGAQAVLDVDRRDSRDFPRRGARGLISASTYEILGNKGGAFARMHAEASSYQPVPAARGFTLAVRAGGDHTWGDFPVQEAAFLGGISTIRGYAPGRFAGDASLWGNVELRSPDVPVFLWLLRARLGTLALADAGRVYVDGESLGGWHTSFGGGLTFSAVDRRYNASMIAAHAPDEWRAYLQTWAAILSEARGDQDGVGHLLQCGRKKNAIPRIMYTARSWIPSIQWDSPSLEISAMIPTDKPTATTSSEVKSRSMGRGPIT